MLLYYSPTSPFARKVRVVARAVGLADRIDEIAVDPFADDSPIPEHNPLGKVPTLIAGDGTVLYDSPVICEYLDEISGRASIFGSGAARWESLRLAALGDGVADAVVALRIESLRPADKRHPPWQQRQLAAVRRALEHASTIDVGLGAVPNIGQIALACALGYMDLRLPEEDWRAAHPGLERWYDKISERPSLAETAHPEPR